MQGKPAGLGGKAIPAPAVQPPCWKEIDVPGGTGRLSYQIMIKSCNTNDDILKNSLIKPHAFTSLPLQSRSLNFKIHKSSLIIISLCITLGQLNEGSADAIHKDLSTEEDIVQNGNYDRLSPLLLMTDVDTDIRRARKDFSTNILEAEHSFLTYDSYGASLLRKLKISPKSVFQMAVQLATLELFGYMPSCWETVSVAQFHLGRVEIVQVIVPAVADFLAAARDSSVSLRERRQLLVSATQAHASLIRRANRAQYFERNIFALRILLQEGEETPALYEDPVYTRARPRKIMSHCFNTGMIEKGFLFRDRDAVWVHYEVYGSR